ncbi:MAG: response regulator [Polyangiales bacterium]
MGNVSNVHGRILVIDDDLFMQKVICELLQKAGYHVVVRDSALGATQVIVGERIDAAVIDWNLPVLNGDEVVRLLRTWDDVKDLPVLLITGAPIETLSRMQDELPDVRVLSKDALRTTLVSALGSVVGRNKTVRGMVPIKLGPKGEYEVPQPRAKAGDLVPDLLEQLAETLPIASTLWSDAARGKREPREQLVERFERLAGQARLLALEEAGSLLQAITDTLRVLPNSRVSRDVKSAVDDGIAALSTLPETADGAFVVPPEPVIQALQRARDELSSAAPS